MAKAAWLILAILLMPFLALSCITPAPLPPSPVPQTPALTPRIISPSPPPSQPTLIPPPGQIQIEVAARNLEVPWSLAFAPDGRLFFTERPGRIMAMEPGKPPQLLATVEAARQSEAGLLGLALSPNFGQDGHFYIYYTYREGGSLKNRVVRLTEQEGKAVNPVVIIEDIPGAGIHDGGRLRFGPDRKLFITTGDAAQQGLAQEPRSVAGKLLRLNPDGSIPADNPLPGSPVYSLGHRNPQGLDWHPSTGQLYAVEHGPSGHDELNLIVPGGNYGWPQVVGKGGPAQFRQPLLESGNGTWAPSGASFYRGQRLAGWQGSLFFAALRGQALHRVAFSGPDFTQVAAHQVLLAGSLGRLRDVVEGPDSSLYIATSNRDGRGQPSADDDRILRVVASGN